MPLSFSARLRLCARQPLTFFSRGGAETQRTDSYLDKYQRLRSTTPLQTSPSHLRASVRNVPAGRGAPSGLKSLRRSAATVWTFGAWRRPWRRDNTCVTGRQGRPSSKMNSPPVSNGRDRRHPWRGGQRESARWQTAPARHRPELVAYKGRQWETRREGLLLAWSGALRAQLLTSNRSHRGECRKWRP